MGSNLPSPALGSSRGGVAVIAERQEPEMPYARAVLITRLDLEGRAIFTRTFASNGSGGVHESHLALDDLGNIVAGSNLTSQSGIDLGGTIFTTDAGSGYTLVKLDPVGSVLWRRPSIEAGPSLMGLAPLPQGGVAVAVSDDRGFLLRSLSAVGDLQWEQRFSNGLGWWSTDTTSNVASGTSGQLAFTFDAEADFAPSPDGGVKLAGCVDLGGGAVCATTHAAPMAATYGPGGAHRWSRQLHTHPPTLTNYRPSVFAQAFDPAGNLFVTGVVSASADFGSGALSTAGGERYLAKFAPDGQLSWVTVFPSQGSGPLLSVSDAGDATVAMYFEGEFKVGGKTLTSADGPWAVLRIDGTGILRGALQLGLGELHPNERFYPKTFTLEPGGGLVFSAVFQGHLHLCGRALESPTAPSTFIAKWRAP